jgi:hypothetical protein
MVGFSSIDLLVIDEAARVRDDLYWKATVANRKPLSDTWTVSFTLASGSTSPMVVRVPRLLKIALRAPRLRCTRVWPAYQSPEESPVNSITERNGNLPLIEDTAEAGPCLFLTSVISS